MTHRRFGFWLVAAALTAVLAACSPATAPIDVPATAPVSASEAAVQTQIVVQTQVVEAETTRTAAPQPTTIPEVSQPGPTATLAPMATTVPPTTGPPTAAPTVSPSPTQVVEQRVVEVEWPPEMRLGGSDLVRLSLIPAADAVEVVTEFEDHTTITQPVRIDRPPGFDLSAIARLDASGFEVSPESEQVQALTAGTTANFRWTVRPRDAGQHRIALTVRLRWTPQPGNNQPERETALYDRGFTIQVNALLGLTTRELAAAGLIGLVFGSTLSLPLAAHALRPRARQRLLDLLTPNPSVVIEQPPGLDLSLTESNLLRALFNAYGRLVIAAEFRSGYSGARTFLAQPIRPDGRADAYTIAKLGERSAIEREYVNYETFVKDTLPPITARIQARPVALAPARRGGELLPAAGSAALRYTFIGEPGQSPASLRAALRADPDPALLEKLFSTFGPNWWMQRRPYTFRLALEYDRLLPTHLVLEPAGRRQPSADLDGRQSPAELALKVGEVVRLQHLRPVELRPDGESLSLAGVAAPGQPPLRARWLSTTSPVGAVARVAATRATLLADMTFDFALLGLPEPLARLPSLLNETISGTQSTIHGDLNLENVLVGPGGFMWLIDFAQTRDGHALFDFAYLEAAIIANVLPPEHPEWPESYAALAAGEHPLQAAVRGMAERCLFNPARWREYRLALFLACLGALKYTNLDPNQKYRLYLTAAALSEHL